MHIWKLGLIALLGACAAPVAVAPTIHLLQPEHRENWEKTNFGGEGEITFSTETVELDFGNPLTGIHWRGSFPKTNFEIELQATRVDGGDFFCCLTFPVGTGHVSLVLGGWGGTTCGLSCIDGKDASENETTRYLSIETGQAYPVRVRVDDTRLKAWFNGELLWDLDYQGRTLTTRPEVELCEPLGVASFSTAARIANFRWRRL